MTSECLQKHDPVEKAKRAMDRKKKTQKFCPGRAKLAKKKETRTPIPAAIKHRIILKANNQCEYIASNGQRCQSKRHLELHHHIPVALGGQNNLENLQLLCFNHHRARHG